MSDKSFDLTQTLFWKLLHKTIKWLMIAASVISTTCMVYAVIKRYLFKGNFYGSDEIIMLFAFWLYFMGAAYGSFENSHIKADLLNVYIRNMRVKDGVNLLAQVLTVAVNTIILIWATRYFSTEIRRWGLSTALKIPLVIPKSSVFFGFLMMEFYHMFYLLRDLYLFFRDGHFTEPRPGDYFTAGTKAKYPAAAIPLKGDAPAVAE